MRIDNCKVNHLSNPLGYELGSPRVSWSIVGAKGKRQQKAVVRVAADENMQEILFETEDADSLGTALEMDLRPRTRYFWTVSVTDDAGDRADSGVNFFETAKMGEDWRAEWITCDADEARHPIFEKSFHLVKEISRARLYVCGLGLYEGYLDGEKIGDEYLTPYCNDYRNWLQYQTFDITDQLKRANDGHAKISFLMGNGWYKGRFGYDSKPGDRGFYGDKYKFIAEIHVTYADGSEDVIGTDDSWEVGRSKITFSNIYDGEYVDDSLGEKPLEKAYMTEEKVPLVARYSLPVRVREERKCDVLRKGNNDLILDTRQNMTGSFRLRVHEPVGTCIRLQFGEVLQNDNFYHDNLRSAQAEYRYISDGQEHVIEPHFTFYGYRYCFIRGLSKEAEERVADDFRALVLCSDVDDVGSLETGHGKVNQLISNIKWGCLDNFLDVPTDCPQRDERMGWTGDAQVFSASATYMHDTYAFYRKFLHDMGLEQRERKGGVPFTVPSFGSSWGDDHGSSVWGDAATIIPWNLYRFSGDVQILREQLPAMKMWVDYMTLKDGSDCGWRRVFHFGDWLALDVPGADASATSGATDVAFIGDVYYMYSAEIVRDAASICGDEEAAAKYGELAAAIRERIGDEFYTKTGRCACDTQTGLVLTLAHGLGDADRAKARLREKLEKNKGKLDCGFTGAPLLCRTLAQQGMDDLAAGLLLNEEFPGWLHEVNLGATTIWERWNSLDERGNISSTGMNSLNHYAYGSILEWMYAYLAGIKASKPGFKEISFDPRPVKELGHLACCYHSAAGEWKSSWKYGEDGSVKIHLEVPFGASARLYIKGHEGEIVGCGVYEF